MKRYQPVARIDNHSYSVDIRLTEMKECKDGEWVSYLESQEIIENLEERIIQLEAECKALMETLGK